MIHFVYKTTHVNGKFYIGRHSTNNENDGYVGSGMWPLSIKDKTTLTREILEYTDTPEKLKILEDKYLAEYFGKPNCMNMTNSSCGFLVGELNYMKNPEIAAKISGNNHWTRKHPEKVLKGETHWFITNPEARENFLQNNPNSDGRSSKLATARGNNVFQTNNPSIRRSEQGIHHWQNGNSPNFGGKLNRKLVEAGTHIFLGPDMNNKRVLDGTHNLMGSASNLKMLASGTHPSQQRKICPHCAVEAGSGMYKRWHGDNCRNK